MLLPLPRTALHTEKQPSDQQKAGGLLAAEVAYSRVQQPALVPCTTCGNHAGLAGLRPVHMLGAKVGRTSELLESAPSTRTGLEHCNPPNSKVANNTRHTIV